MVYFWNTFYTIGGLSYLFLVGMIVFGLVKLGRSSNGGQPSDDNHPKVSVIISARNEEHNLPTTLSGLLAQNYPSDKYEIIVIDDRSDDGTADIVTGFSSQYPRVKLAQQTTVIPGISPKKQALEKGINTASGEIIMTTDADCLHHPNWISEMIAPMTHDVGMVIGQARFCISIAGCQGTAPDSNTTGSAVNCGGLTADYDRLAAGKKQPLWQRLQALDFQSLGYASAGLVSTGMPFTCSGASFAYRKTLFDEIEGWKGYDNLISGDDELLLTKASSSRWKIAVSTSPAAIVNTAPAATLYELWQQRTRWGSKGLYYRPSRKLILIGVFLFMLSLTIAPIVWLISGLWKFWIGWSLVRLLMDLTALRLGCKLFKEKFKFLEFLLLEIIYPLQIVVFAIAGHFTGFEWKGQQFHSKGEKV
ncbi:MAG: glycosyltransferase [Candidatus Hatepunaea meridiana]|nr:glycosyltransferase [Candidatus Hatepunaea meridiana]